MARAAVSVASASVKLLTHKLCFEPLSSISFHSPSKKNKKNSINSSTKALASTTPKSKLRSSSLELKRRTRSDKEFDVDYMRKYGDQQGHIPVMLGEVLDVFPSSLRLRSFVDCTLGAAGHSSAAHPELQTYIGLDVDPVALKKAQSRIRDVLNSKTPTSSINMKAHVLLRNFKEIKQVIYRVDNKLLLSGVDGILMDLGMSSMQVDDAGRGFSMMNNGPLDMRMNPEGILKAEDILNSWPPDEVGRILRDYGEESNWYSLQNQIVKARPGGGLRSTGDLVNLIRCSTSKIKGGRQGWIKTAARVFQALRIAVNDELKILEDSLYSCFECLSSGGRLAVISFHSLEDRIVKQSFLKFINGNIQGSGGTAAEEQGLQSVPEELNDNPTEKEAWIKQVVKGSCGVILTKRPITASSEEEKVNSRCRSAKLRVIQKL